MLIILMLCSQLTLADSLYARGYHEEARLEYLRVFFFYPQLKQNVEARLHYAVSIIKVDGSKGISELNKLVNEFPRLPMNIRREIAGLYIDTGRYYSAISLLRDTEERDLLGLAYLLDGQFSNARATFLQDGNIEIADLIDAYLESPEKSERIAVLLSLFLPGAGEVYAGNSVLGLRDFLVNLGSGYLFYNALRQQKYVDATLVFLFLVNRFYLGSIHNAQKSAIEHNEKRRREWLERVVETHFADINTKPH